MPPIYAEAGRRACGLGVGAVAPACSCAHLARRDRRGVVEAHDEHRALDRLERRGVRLVRH